MPRTTLPPDPWVGLLIRRLLLLSLGLLLLTYLAPRPWTRSPLTAAAEVAAPGAPAERILPAGTLPLEPLGGGVLLPPFEVDDVEHSAFGWALLDRRAGEVLVLDPVGSPVRRVGRRGAGPGELERPLDVALAPDGTVAVLDASGQRVDVLPVSGLPQRIPVDGRACNGTFGDDIVHHDRAWWIVRRCFDGPNADLEIHRVPRDGPAERVERRVLTRMNTDPHLVPLLVPVGGRLYAGSNLEPCLAEVAGDRHLCLPHPPRIPIPDSAATRIFGDLERRAAAIGLDLRIPTHYPGLVEVRARPAGPAVRTILADGSDAWAIEARDTLRIIEPGQGARVEPGAAGWLLLRDDAAGLRVWTVPEPSRPPGVSG